MNDCSASPVTLNETRNHTLDFVKLVASFFVVCIHFKFSGMTGVAVDAVARFAVPFFFLSSGYFSYSNELPRLQRKIKRIFMLTLLATLLYTAYDMLQNFVLGGFPAVGAYLLRCVHYETLLKLILFNDPFTSSHLWFLYALIYLYFIEWLFRLLHVSDSFRIKAALILLAISIVAGEGLAFFGYAIPEYMRRNFLLLGFPFFSIGIYIKKNKHLLSKFNSEILWLFITIGSIEAAVSRLSFSKNEIYIGSVFAAISVFLMAIKAEKVKIGKAIIVMANCSTGIYIIHKIAGSAIGNTAELINIPVTSAWWTNLEPVIVFASSLIFMLLFNAVISAVRKRLKKS